MASQVVKVRREKVAACMTCPICNKILEEATTISLCLHTFCRKCIHEKLSDDDVDSCPVCGIHLGCVPVEKLRPDHNLQDIRAKIFPIKGKKVEVREVTPTNSPPTKRKERSLSLLAVSAPRVPMQGGVTGRRSRGGVRKGSEKTPKKEEHSVEDPLDGSSSPETLNKIMQNKQNSLAKSSNDQIRGEQIENNNEGREGKVDLWKPLNTLVEAANRSKSSKSNSQGPSVKSDPSGSGAGDINIRMGKMKIEENGERNQVQDDKNGMPSVPKPVKRNRMRPSNKKRSSTSAEICNLSGVENGTRRNWKDGPVWFSLVASNDQVGGEPLPQVSAAYLRVKDGNMPVSSIQKYIAKKLDLKSEAEVQIMCQGQAVMSHLKLSSLLDVWVHSFVPQKKVQTSVGNSAQEFVMVLNYARNVATPST